MAEQVKRFQVGMSSELYIDRIDARHPFLKSVNVFCHRYIVGTDFDSGDSLRLDIDGAQKILYAVAKTPSSTLLTIAETDLATETGDSTRQGISLTTGTSTTDIQIYIVAEM
jgi:hypothetical protein